VCVCVCVCAMRMRWILVCYYCRLFEREHWACMRIYKLSLFKHALLSAVHASRLARTSNLLGMLFMKSSFSTFFSHFKVISLQVWLCSDDGVPRLHVRMPAHEPAMSVCTRAGGSLGTDGVPRLHVRMPAREPAMSVCTHAGGSLGTDGVPRLHVRMPAREPAMSVCTRAGGSLGTDGVPRLHVRMPAHEPQLCLFAHVQAEALALATSPSCSTALPLAACLHWGGAVLRGACWQEARGIWPTKACTVSASACVIPADGEGMRLRLGRVALSRWKRGDMCGIYQSSADLRGGNQCVAHVIRPMFGTCDTSNVWHMWYVQCAAHVIRPMCGTCDLFNVWTCDASNVWHMWCVNVWHMWCVQCVAHMMRPMCGICDASNVWHMWCVQCVAHMMRPMCGTCDVSNVWHMWYIQCAAHVIRPMCGTCDMSNVRHMRCVQCVVHVIRPMCGTCDTSNVWHMWCVQWRLLSVHLLPSFRLRRYGLRCWGFHPFYLWECTTPLQCTPALPHCSALQHCTTPALHRYSAWSQATLVDWCSSAYLVVLRHMCARTCVLCMCACVFACVCLYVCVCVRVCVVCVCMGMPYG